MPATTPPTRRSPSRRPATTSRPRGAARRAALLEATLSLVAELGVDAVTHRAVAARADLPLASTTYWFDSKEQLLTEALRHAADRDRERVHHRVRRVIDAAHAGAAPVTPAAIAAVVFDPDPDSDPSADRSAVLAAFSLILEAARRPGMQAIASDWTSAYLEMIGELLACAGSARPADDARLVMAASDGLLIDRIATGTAGLADPGSELTRLITGLLA